MLRSASTFPFRISHTSRMYVPLVSATMTRAKRLLSGLECSAITEPGIGGSQSGPEQPTRAITVAEMRVANRDEKCIMITVVRSDSSA